MYGLKHNTFVNMSLEGAVTRDDVINNIFEKVTCQYRFSLTNNDLYNGAKIVNFFILNFDFQEVKVKLGSPFFVNMF